MWWLTAAKSLQPCSTLCDPIDGSPPGFPIPGILQARTLEWVAISFSNAWKWKAKGKSLSHVRLFVTPWISARQASLSITNSWSLLKFMSIESVMPSNHLILCHPWDSPGKNTGVGCHVLFQCIKEKSEREVTQSCLTLSNPMDCSLPGSSIHRILQARVLPP